MPGLSANIIFDEQKPTAARPSANRTIPAMADEHGTVISMTRTVDGEDLVMPRVIANDE